MRHLELLNAVQKQLIDHANEKGISLQDEFGTVDEFKKFVFAFTFKVLVDIGTPVNRAYDMIAGDGEYDRMAEDTWNAARA